MNVFVAFPTANSAAADNVLREWHAMGYCSCVLIDAGQKPTIAKHHLEAELYKGFSWAANLLCQICLNDGADIVVLAGDDLHPDPTHTAQDIAGIFRQRFPDLYGVMQPTGDKFGAIKIAAISPWIGRAFIRRAYAGKGPYFEGYRHLWADTELHDVATKLGVYYEREDLSQYHAHHTRGHADNLVPAKRQLITEADATDRVMYRERRKAGFPGHEPASVEAT